MMGIVFLSINEHFDHSGGFTNNILFFPISISLSDFTASLDNNILFLKI